MNEDPLKDISGASKIAGLLRGKWIGIDEITKRMKEIEMGTVSLTAMSIRGKSSLRLSDFA